MKTLRDAARAFIFLVFLASLHLSSSASASAETFPARSINYEEFKSEYVPYELQNDYQPYYNYTSETKTITHPGAVYIRVFFEKIDVESYYDHVAVSDFFGTQYAYYSGLYESIVTPYIPGEEVQIFLYTDSIVTDWGWKVTGYQVLE